MNVVVAVLRVIGAFLPFLARMLPIRVKPAGPIEPVKEPPWAKEK